MLYSISLCRCCCSTAGSCWFWPANENCFSRLYIFVVNFFRVWEAGFEPKTLYFEALLLTTKPPTWTLCQALCSAKFCLLSFVCVAKQFISFNLPGFNNSRNFFYILLIKVRKLGLFCWKRTHEKTFIFL